MAHCYFERASLWYEDRAQGRYYTLVLGDVHEGNYYFNDYHKRQLVQGIEHFGKNDAIVLGEDKTELLSCFDKHVINSELLLRSALLPCNNSTGALGLLGKYCRSNNINFSNVDYRPKLPRTINIEQVKRNEVALEKLSKKFLHHDEKIINDIYAEVQKEYKNAFLEAKEILKRCVKNEHMKKSDADKLSIMFGSQFVDLEALSQWHIHKDKKLRVICVGADHAEEIEKWAPRLGLKPVIANKNPWDGPWYEAQNFVEYKSVVNIEKLFGHIVPGRSLKKKSTIYAYLFLRNACIATGFALACYGTLSECGNATGNIINTWF